MLINRTAFSAGAACAREMEREIGELRAARNGVNVVALKPQLRLVGRASEGGAA